MTELGFLIELLLNHELKAETRKLIGERIKEVESGFNRVPIGMHPPKMVPGQPAQAASMQAIMDRNPDIGQPVAVVAQTPAAIAAMNSRNIAIQESIAGKTDKVTGRPRKF